jgi:hypothetical protein
MNTEDYRRYFRIATHFQFLSSQHPNIDLRLWTPPPLRLNRACAPLHNIRVQGPIEEHYLSKIRGSNDIGKTVYVSREGFDWDGGGEVLVRMNPEQLWRWAGETSVEEIEERDAEAIAKAETRI